MPSNRSKPKSSIEKTRAFKDKLRMEGVEQPHIGNTGCEGYAFTNSATSFLGCSQPTQSVPATSQQTAFGQQPATAATTTGPSPQIPQGNVATPSWSSPITAPSWTPSPLLTSSPSTGFTPTEGSPFLSNLKTSTTPQWSPSSNTGSRPFAFNSSGGSGQESPSNSSGLGDLSCGNLPYIVLVPLQTTEPPNPIRDYIMVTPFREQPALPYPREFLNDKLKQVRYTLNESIKNDKLRANAAQEKKLNVHARVGVRSYAIPSEDEQERTLENHAIKLRNYIRAKADVMRPMTGEVAGNRHFAFVSESVSPEAHRRATRHWNLITSMDERQLHLVNEENESRSTQARLPRKTDWKRLDMSTVKEALFGKKARPDEPAGERKRVKSGVVLKSPSYYCKPSISELDELTDSTTGQCLVRNFEVGHQIHGKIVFPDEINVAGINLDQTIRFRHGEIQLYYGDQPIPPFRQGLHHPFIATLTGMYPRFSHRERWNTSTFIPTAAGEGQITSTRPSPIQMYERVLSQACNRFGGEFLGYDYRTTSWSFKLERLDSFNQNH